MSICTERNWFCLTVLWQMMIPQYFRNKELIYKTVNCLAYDYAILITYRYHIELRNKTIAKISLKKARILKMKLLDMIISQNCLGLSIFTSKSVLKISDQYLKDWLFHRKTFETLFYLIKNDLWNELGHVTLAGNRNCPAALRPWGWISLTLHKTAVSWK